MPTIFAANESQVLVGGQPIEGVRSIEYRTVQVRENVFGLGGNERIGMVSGPQVVEGRIRVASTAPALDALTVNDSVQIIAQLGPAASGKSVTFDECFLQEKSFDMSVGSFGESLYSFTATRATEGAGS